MNKQQTRSNLSKQGYRTRSGYSQGQGYQEKRKTNSKGDSTKKTYSNKDGKWGNKRHARGNYRKVGKPVDTIQEALAEQIRNIKNPNSIMGAHRIKKLARVAMENKAVEKALSHGTARVLGKRAITQAGTNVAAAVAGTQSNIMANTLLTSSSKTVSNDRDRDNNTDKNGDESGKHDDGKEGNGGRH